MPQVAALVSSLAALAPVLVAQTAFTSPRGFLLAEGPSAVQFNNPFHEAAARYQYVDADLRGQARPGLRSLALRRDGSQVSASPARTVDVEIVLAETDATQLSTSFAANYGAGETIVFARKVVVLPDHTQVPQVPPAPFDLVFSFDQIFSYAGSLDLLWELRVHANSGTGQAYSLDSADTRVPGEGRYAYLGFESCVTALGPYWIHGLPPATDAQNLARFQVWAERAPPNAPSVLVVGLGDSGFNSYLCAPLRSSADVLIPLLSGSGGSLGSAAAPVTFRIGLVAPLRLHLQFASLDPLQAPNLMVALSDAVTVDAVLYEPGPDLYRLAATGSATAAAGALARDLVPVARFSY